jgi:hypothetical protein
MKDQKKKDLNSTKVDQRGKTRTGKKKKKTRREHEYLSLVSVVCCQIEVSATYRLLVQRTPTLCGVSE